MTFLSISLNKRITLQAPNATLDECGQPSSAWVNMMTVSAAIMDMTGREYVTSSEQNEVVTTILIRARDGVTPRMRVVHGATVYNIDAVIEQFDRTLRLMCKRLQ